jgi:hypothetical protein
MGVKLVGRLEASARGQDGDLLRGVCKSVHPGDHLLELANSLADMRFVKPRAPGTEQGVLLRLRLETREALVHLLLESLLQGLLFRGETLRGQKGQEHIGFSW